jgi:hypothetical protein
MATAVLPFFVSGEATAEPSFMESVLLNTQPWFGVANVVLGLLGLACCLANLVEGLWLTSLLTTGALVAAVWLARPPDVVLTWGIWVLLAGLAFQVGAAAFKTAYKPRT